MRVAVLAGALFALALPAQAAEFNASLSVAPEVDTPNRASPYYVGPPVVPVRHSRQELELRLREGGFNAQGTLRWQAEAGRKPERHGVGNQFYYDGDAGAGIGWTVGKKVMSWGVGHGFRPLDVVQREDRRSVNPPALVGVPLLAIERFSADEAWTLVWTQPGAGAGNDDRSDAALALHWYGLAGSDDLHGVARISHRRGFEAGLGATHVIGEEWSLHGAVLRQNRYRQKLNALADNGGLLAAADPMAETLRRGGTKAVAGAQWTGQTDAGGWSVLMEAWYDADAYSRGQWQRLDELAARQQALAGLAPDAAIAGNAAWSSQAYLATNLLRDNLMLRLAYDDRDGFKPFAELLATPADGGRVLSVGATFQGNRNRWSVGLRQLGGADDSAYARAPVKRLAWAEWRLAAF